MQIVCKNAGEQRAAGGELQEIGERALFGLWVQHLVGPVIGGRAAEKFFKEFVKVAGIVKADREGEVGNGAEILLGVHQFFGGFIDAVFHQILERTHLQCPGKTTAALAFTDMDAVGNVFE